MGFNNEEISIIANIGNCLSRNKNFFQIKFYTKPKEYTLQQWLETGPTENVENLENRLQLERNKWWQRDRVKIRALQYNLQKAENSKNRRSYLAKGRFHVISDICDAGGQWFEMDRDSGEMVPVEGDWLLDDFGKIIQRIQRDE